ncbi:hypothetical protein THIOKS1910038 [Thiocapsa sp. KS1]|nr:hypothetical protein THIOKS1910038 [Thiocapsa sp. KS1]
MRGSFEIHALSFSSIEAFDRGMLVDSRRGSDPYRLGPRVISAQHIACRIPVGRPAHPSASAPRQCVSIAAARWAVLSREASLRPHRAATGALALTPIYTHLSIRDVMPGARPTRSVEVQQVRHPYLHNGFRHDTCSMVLQRNRRFI